MKNTVQTPFTIFAILISILIFSLFILNFRKTKDENILYQKKTDTYTILNSMNKNLVLATLTIFIWDFFILLLILI